MAVLLVLLFSCSLTFFLMGSVALSSQMKHDGAEIPREMIIGSDWVVSRLYHVRYFEKNGLGYWMYPGSLMLSF